MNKTLRNMMLAAAAAALAAQSASANTYNTGDVLLEFKANGGAADVIFDAGSYTQFENGTSFDLSTKGYSSSLLSSVGASGDANLQFAAVAYGGAVRTYLVTDATGNNVTHSANNTAAGNVDAQIANQGSTYSSGAATSLSSTAVKETTTTQYSYTYDGVNLHGTLSGTAAGDTAYNPNTSALFELFSGTTGPVVEGTFTFNDTTGDLFYNSALAVPEPTTYGLLAGAGLLALCFRRQFSRKNA